MLNRRRTRWFQNLAGAFLGFIASAPAVHGDPSAVMNAEAQLSRSLACIAASDTMFNALLALDEDVARAQARRIDSNGTAGPLAGMPVLLKDNIETAELPTTAGSLLLAGNARGRNAPLVAQLRAAGAVIVGKTNLSEWANFRSKHSSSGWSAVGGQTVNALDITRNPCGSSSGSAVAVARGYVPMAVGTETSGSIVCPAASNGVVGLKPTHGLVSGAGIVPLAGTQDTAGPIAIDVMTAAQTLAVMADPSADNSASVQDGLQHVDALASSTGLRIGVWSESLDYDPRRDAELEAVLATLQADGAEIIEGIAVARHDEFSEDAYRVLLYEFKRDIADYLADAPSGVAARNLDDLIRLNKLYATSELAVFDQSIFLAAQELEDTEADYRDRLQRIRKSMRDDSLDKAFSEHRLDAIIGITSSLPGKIDPVNGDSWFGNGMASPAAIAGNPHISLPLAQVGGLPMGISLYGKRWQDHRLVQIAYRLESLHPKPVYAWPAGTPESFSLSCVPEGADRVTPI